MAHDDAQPPESSARIRLDEASPLRAILERLPDQVFELDRSGRILYVNRVEPGQQQDAVLGSSYLDWIAEADRESLMQGIGNALESGTSHEFELRSAADLGPLHWYAAHVEPLDGDGKASSVLLVTRDITQSRRLEEALLESETRWDTLVLHIPDIVTVLDGEGIIRFINRGVTQPNPEGIIGRSLYEFVAADNHARVRQTLDTALNTGVPQSIDIPIIPADDRMRWFACRAGRIPARGGTFQLMVIAVETTPQKEAQAELARAEAQYRALVENLNDVIFKQDKAGRTTYVSPVVKRIGGYEPEEIIGRSFTEFVHPDDLPDLLASRERTLAGAIEPFECRVFAKDGSLRHVRTSSRVVLESGEVTGLFGVLTDITEQKQSEQALRDSEARYRSLYDNAPLAFVLWGPDYRVRDWNKRAEEMFGFTREETLGQLLCDFLIPASAQPQVNNVLADIAHGKDSTSLNENVTKSGAPILCEWNHCLRYDEEGTVREVLSLALDVTERKQAEEQRRHIEEQIQHAQKLESLGVLAGGIAHDFNNLLVAILGNADFALADLPKDSPVREHLEEISSASQRAADLCRQLLAYSGRARFLVAPLNLADLVQEMSKLLEVSLTKKADMQRHFEPDLPLIEGDPTQLRQVVMNLVTNAAESYEARHGVVEIRVSHRECERDYLNETYLRDDLPEGQYVCLEVRDYGCGMDAITRQKLFEPFFTTKFSGRGLGLAAVLGIVRGHRGAIQVESEPDEGTSIRLFFPACTEELALPPKPGPQAAAWKGSGTILIVDDEQDMRSVSSKILERAGFSVLLAADGEEGVAKFRAHADELALVILDVTMPKLNGPQAFRKMRRINKTVPVLLTSGYTEQNTLSQFTSKGLAGFLPKPFNKQQMLDKVREALEIAPEG